MSCFIVSPENIRAQAEFISCIMNDSYNNRYRMSAADSLYDVFAACKGSDGYSAHKIYRALYIANLRAYNGRYHEDVKTFDKYVKTAPPADLVQLHKYMRCYLYQCAEEPVYKTPIYNAIRDLARDLAEHLVMRAPGYDDKEWN